MWAILENRAEPEAKGDSKGCEFLIHGMVYIQIIPVIYMIKTSK